MAEWSHRSTGPSTVARNPFNGTSSPIVPSNKIDARGSDAKFRVCSARSEIKRSGDASCAQATITNDAKGQLSRAREVASVARLLERMRRRAAAAISIGASFKALNTVCLE